MQFTNIHCQPDNFISANKHFAKSALTRYTPADFIALLKSIASVHEKTLGQLFCDRSAQNVTDMWKRNAGGPCADFSIAGSARCSGRRSSSFALKRGVHARTGCRDRRTIHPKMGATAFGYELARQFG